MRNRFLDAATSHDTLTENGALSHSTSGSINLDYFSKIGTYRSRKEEDVFSDVSSSFGEDPNIALAMIFYNRMITRKPTGFFESDSIHKGQGQKDEFIKSLKWLENSYPEVLQKNIWLVPVVGCWKDLWHDSASSKYVHYVNTEWVYDLIIRGIEDDYNRGLIAKFLPKIRSKSNTKNDRQRRLNAWARGFCAHIGWTEADYRKFKSDPENTAHLFQRKMCAGFWEDIDFNVIPGKALFNLLSRKGRDGKNSIERHGLEPKYLEWIKSKPVAKFTGYVYELFKAATNGSPSLVERLTYNSQFEGLLEKAKVDSLGIKENVWTAIDTSGSMQSVACGNVTALDVCLSLGIYFSSLNEGAFKDNVIMFDSKSTIKTLSGTFTDKAGQLKNAATAWGNTNFQSVIDEIIRVRKSNPSIPIEDYPTTLLVVSDLQFDRTLNNNTNYKEAMRKLNSVGLPNIQIIWWNVNARGNKDVPNKMDDIGVVMISGFDPTAVSLILGGEQEVDIKTGEKRMLTPHENMIKTLDQDVLKQLKV